MYATSDMCYKHEMSQISTLIDHHIVS